MVEINLLKLNFNDKEFSHIRDIRETVFTNELGISKQELFDKNDETCDHFLIFDGKEIVGSVRILSMENVVKLDVWQFSKISEQRIMAKIAFFN